MCTPATTSDASAHLSRDLAIVREAPPNFLALQSQTPQDIKSAYRKGAQNENGHVINYFQDTYPSAKFVAWFH
jgi:hypothetical protein